MPPATLYSPERADIIKEIERKLRRSKFAPASHDFEAYSSTDFERDIARILNDLFPFSVLAGVRIFSAEQKQGDYGYEIDNAVHIRFESVDYVITIEAKKQSVLVEKDNWWTTYAEGRKCCREQVDNHIRTLWEYLGPLPRDTELRFISLIVSSDSSTKHQTAAGYRNAEVHLCSASELPAVLQERFRFGDQSPAPEVFRVSQSRFLDLLRLGQPVEHLGHPELVSAIRYVERCRRSLDESLFRLFDPKADRWVINGSAGMGKSVLLAYAAAVLSSGHELYQFQGEVGVKKASDAFAKMNFSPDPNRGTIAIMAMSAKQLANLQGWFSFFARRFQDADTEGAVRFRPPEFIPCRDKESFGASAENWAALLVDEAHDLPAYAAREVVRLYNRGGMYLIVACDRHQKLRLGNADAKIIDGLDFTRKSTRLRQIYRNPAPVYIASLALMFRWFAREGPKVVPSPTELKDQFGFQAEKAVGSDASIIVNMMSDAHPANSWCHTVGTFPDVITAYGALAKEKFNFREVLWVRFSTEDPDFDYEQLNQRFTYHVCRTNDASKISDKYIKGQDYPIVVVEGFPGFMDRYEGENPKAAEQVEAQMWAFRRELYLCASRATAFLYFVCNVTKTPEAARIQDELHRLVDAVAKPVKVAGDPSGGTKCWRFRISPTKLSRSLAVYTDTVDGAVLPSADGDLPTVEKAPVEDQTAGPALSETDLSSNGAVDSPASPELPVNQRLESERQEPAQEPGTVVAALPKREVAEIPIVAAAAAPEDTRPVLRLPEIVTPRNLAPFFGEPPIQLLRDILVHQNFKVERDSPLPREIISKLCAARGYRPEFGAGDGSSA